MSNRLRWAVLQSSAQSVDERDNACAWTCVRRVESLQAAIELIAARSGLSAEEVAETLRKRPELWVPAKKRAWTIV